MDYRALTRRDIKTLVPNLRTIAWQTHAVWMLFASIFKREWTIDDYPIRVEFQPPTEALHAPRLKPRRFYGQPA
jgi:hypothetical protein